jgi:splicing factor 3B subunit 1
MHAFQKQINDNANVMLNVFGTMANVMGQKVKPYLLQICKMMKWRLNNRVYIKK